MKTGSLRRRLTWITLSMLAVVLLAVGSAVTLAYRSSLRSDLRAHLHAAAAAVARADSATVVKELDRGLALEGIATSVSGPAVSVPPKRGASAPPVKAGSEIEQRGSLLVVSQLLPDGTLVSFSASSSGITSAVNRLLAVEAIVGLCALALAAALVMWGARTALRPFSQVIETAQRIATGDIELRLAPTRTDTELGTMAAAFDRMVDALQRAVTDARSAERATRRFLADASHELRTPIAALALSAESLLREQPQRPARDAIEASLARSAHQLGRLVDDLLNLARLEGTTAMPRQPVDLAAVAAAVVAEARLAADAPTIVAQLDEARALGDADGLRRVVHNLLDNACASVPARGRVEVSTARNAACVELRVCDDGPGVPPSEREHIFERFVRLEQTPRAGTGLGLAIARRIARQHDGELTCDETHRGAAFTLRLPALER